MRIERKNIYDIWTLGPNKYGGGTLTAYLPDVTPMDGTERKRPGVLILPGGAYAYCSRREAEPVALRFTAAGWCAFVLEYSVAPIRFPVSLREAAASMAWIRRNADALGVDGGMVAAVGFSAGGHLCGTLGTMFDCPEVADVAEPAEIRPDALGLCYPVAVSWGRTHGDSFVNLTGEDEELRARLSLEKLVRQDMMPVFLWHTRDDGSVPCRNSLLTALALEEAGVPFALHIYGHGQHGLSTADEQVYSTFALPETSGDVAGWVQAMLGFFREQGLRIHDREVRA